MATASMSPAELKSRVESGEKVDLIDVRTPVEYREAHVSFARNIPLDRLKPADFANGPSDGPVYFVCRSGSRGRQACEMLAKHGCQNGINIEGGTVGCEQAGLPITRGKAAMSLERQVRIAAGSLVLVGTVLGWFVHPAFLGLSAFVGAGLVFAGVTDTCGMGLLLSRMPWNRIHSAPTSCSTV